MKVVKVYYLLDEKGRKESIKQDGDGKELQVLDIELTNEILDMERCRVLEDGRIIMAIGFNFDVDSSELFGHPIESWLGEELLDLNIDFLIIQNIYGKKMFDNPMTFEELMEWENDRVNYIQRKRIELEAQVAENKKQYELENEDIDF